MKQMKTLQALSLVFFWSIAAQAKDVAELPWHKISTPSSGGAVVHGSYSAGCFSGGVALPNRGQGYQLARKERHRYFGHPLTIDFIQRLGRAVDQAGLGVLLISDISQPRGGPFGDASAHASHQTGLDVDIWYRRIPKHRKMSPLIAPVSLTSKTKFTLYKKHWSDDYAKILRTASRHYMVERIFVNPGIKKKLCELHKGEIWLAKIRPWWGHNQHFHVRLRCPKGQPFCQSQRPIAPGDGCDEVESWFEKLQKPREKKERKEIVLPKACDGIYRAGME